MQNEFFGLKCGLFQGFKQGTKACRLGFMGLGAGFSPRKVGLQGASSLSLSLSLVS